MNKTITIAILGILLATMLLSLTSIVTAVTVDSVRSEPDEIAPGETAKIMIRVENNLNRDVENIIVNLNLKDLPFAPHESGTEEIIDELGDDEEKTLVFDLVALSDAESGIYKIPVIISYEDDDEVKERESYISLTINSKPELKIDYEDNLIRGKNSELNIKIINSGLSDVKLLSVRVSDIVGLKVLGSKYIYIGNLDSDDFDIAKFEVLINENAGSIINLPVEINYRDATNNIYSDNINLALKTYSTREAIELGLIKKSRTGIYAGVIVAIFLIYIFYRKIRKSRKKKA